MHIGSTNTCFHISRSFVGIGFVIDLNIHMAVLGLYTLPRTHFHQDKSSCLFLITSITYFNLTLASFDPIHIQKSCSSSSLRYVASILFLMLVKKLNLLHLYLLFAMIYPATHCSPLNLIKVSMPSLLTGCFLLAITKYSCHLLFTALCT